MKSMPTFKHEGLTFSEGTIVDAAIIAAQLLPKTRRVSATADNASNQEGNQWHFGMKLHIGVDQETGLVHSAVTTAANAHDINIGVKSRKMPNILL
ncbi:MAG: transposase [Ghiorsea sp.]|nr:transposase [Ghiorsea sp.]